MLNPGIAAVGKSRQNALGHAQTPFWERWRGHDPANQKTTERDMPTVAELADRFMADRFMADHVRAERKAGTAQSYRNILDGS